MYSANGHQPRHHKATGNKAGVRSFGTVEQLLAATTTSPKASSTCTVGRQDNHPNVVASSLMTPEPIISDKNNGVLSGPGATKLFRRRYRLLETLGVGTFSTVRAALDVATGVKWACKV
eukprot:CAMPEP_0177784466 /NCGR_PEP_ID=MMETSP0491_2-20121128/19727_1 /TAXON_ID=63592 /ORGANISM="Tetraselmis chuii, Strain PLY429" /LENGTH=118 /DNA_ID=CAMNT_0019305257 /DNA_START=297 /DNA_END=650 /DNA_ORIENTATION=+